MAYPAVVMERVVPLHNKDYYDYLTYHIERARRRIWANIFIINVLRAEDPDLEIRSLCKLLGAAVYRGVDVRVLVGDSVQTVHIRELNAVSRDLMRIYRVRCRTALPTERSSTHDKIVLIDDDLVLIGSHNWTHRAFNESEEDSIAVRSVDMSRRLEDQFLIEWHAAMVWRDDNEQ